jgi:prepilin-type N-terminal cleavage/methylation domain-containing protein
MHAYVRRYVVVDMRFRRHGARAALQFGFTLVETLVVSAIAGIILAIAIPALKDGHFRVSSRETTAVREMQSVVRAQSQYRARFGKYAASLDDLAAPGNGRAKGPRAAGLIPVSLASGEKDGYLFTMVLTRTGYALIASPRIYAVNGRRTFYVNQDGVVHESLGERPASADSKVFK